MRKKTKIILIICIVLIGVCSFIFYKTFYTAHRDIASEKSEISIIASELQLNYTKDYTLANKNYADKVIETKGTITSVEDFTIVLDNMVQIDFLDEETSNLMVGQSISVKGRCVGYDDLLEVVKLDQALVLTNKK